MELVVVDKGGDAFGFDFFFYHVGYFGDVTIYIVGIDALGDNFGVGFFDAEFLEPRIEHFGGFFGGEGLNVGLVVEVVFVKFGEDAVEEHFVMISGRFFGVIVEGYGDEVARG